MEYTEEFLESLKVKPLEGAQAVIQDIFKSFEDGPSWTPDDLQVMTVAIALFEEMSEAGLLPIAVGFTALPSIATLDQRCSNMKKRLDEISQEIRDKTAKTEISSVRSRFKSILGSGFLYEFSQGDLERTQRLLNELRETIGSNEKLEPDHKSRLLRRLEALQSELHKKISDLDKFWGLIGDAGVVLGKLGKDAKPIVDRVREIADIVWQTQSRAEELPSGTSLPQIGRDSPGEDQSGHTA